MKNNTNGANYVSPACIVTMASTSCAEVRTDECIYGKHSQNTMSPKSKTIA